MAEKTKRRGRPLKGDTKKNVVAMRIDDNTRDMLNDICMNYGVSKSELIQKWAKNQHEMMKMGVELL
nr:hypothetical protein [uncultured Mediterraneibacter sp.]